MLGRTSIGKNIAEVNGRPWLEGKTSPCNSGLGRRKTPEITAVHRKDWRVVTTSYINQRPEAAF